jgi:hypothetical protein
MRVADDYRAESDNSYCDHKAIGITVSYPAIKAVAAEYSIPSKYCNLSSDVLSLILYSHDDIKEGGAFPASLT